MKYFPLLILLAFLVFPLKKIEGNYWIGIGNKIVEAKRLSENEFTIVKIWSKNNSPVIQFYLDNNKRI